MILFDLMPLVRKGTNPVVAVQKRIISFAILLRWSNEVLLRYLSAAVFTTFGTREGVGD